MQQSYPPGNACQAVSNLLLAVCAMATMTLHDVPEDLLSRLQQRAQAHGRSLNSEVVDCLKRQATGSGDADADADAWLADVEHLRAQVLGGPIPVEELVAATERESH